MTGVQTCALPISMQDKKLPGIAAEDIGKTALGIYKAGEKYQGKTLGIAGEMLTVKEMADGFGELLGTEVAYNEVPASAFRSFDFPGAEDMGNMFQFKAEFEKEYCDARDIEETRKLNPELLSFSEWLQKNEEKIKA